MSAPAIRVSGQAEIGGATLFGPLDLTLEPGGWTCLLGPSGVGKSTILRLIAGLDTGARFTGQITADGGPLPPSHLAYMAQDDLLLPWRSVLGNVMLGAELRGQKAERARAEKLLSDVGLAAHSGKRPAALSGGQRQRVALARTLMEDRPVVLLDEPFSALDARTRADMQDLAFGLLAGRSVLLVTHDPAEAARLGHRIFVLESHGLAQMPTPPGAPLRAVDDPALLTAQAQLLQHLRGKA
ncbi:MULTISPECIES: ABC transporter ATP-binding protein [unclassified Meridianimarinicoccus]|uniref:ABC transporter ATP-binding protein n=1 Tax=unclassified Meridianimarinicoccus TaxID=2923344 RepID=UPI0018679D74|nr:ABC transporter ATP-binding protein [Fluviibacterium sp. MJW13]